MTLHEAILTVLKNNSQPMKPREITLEINKYGLCRSSEEAPVTVDEVWERINVYADTLFIIDENKSILLSEGYSLEFDKVINLFRSTVRQRPYEGKSMELLMTLLLVDYYTNTDWYRNNPVIGDLRDKLIEIIDSLKRFDLQKSFYDRLVADNHQLWKDDYELLNRSFRSIREILDELSRYQVLSLIRKFLAQSKASEKGMENFTAPKVLSEYVLKIAELKDGQNVLDHLSHDSSLLPEIAHGNSDTNLEMWSYNLLGKSYDIFELILSGKKFRFRCDSNPFEISSDNLYDWVITVPPFGYIPKGSKSNYHHSDDTYPYVYEKLNAAGKAIVIVTEAFLHSAHRENGNFLRFLLKKNALTAVVSLPKTFYRGIKTAAIFIYKGNESSSVFLGDYGQFTSEEFGYKLDQLISWQRRKIAVDAISINVNFSDLLNSEILDLTPRKAILRQTLSHNKQDGYKKLKELIVRRIPGKAVQSTRLNTDKEGIPHLRISDLSGDPDYISLVTPPAKYITDFEKFAGTPKVKQGTVALARFGSELKATVYDCDEPAIPSHHLMCFDVDTSIISPGYLVSELYSKNVKQQLAAIQISGVGAPHYSEKDLLEIVISVPSLESQNSIMHGKKEKAMEAFFLKEPALLKKASDKESAADKSVLEKEIISSIQHRIAQFVSPVSSDIKNLKYYYRRKSEEQSTMEMTDRISGRPNAATISETFDRIESNLSGIAETFKLMSDVLFYNNAAVNFKKSNVFELIQMAYDSVNDHRMEGVEFILESRLVLDADKTISLAPNQVIELLRNFFINSIKHGFTEEMTDKVIHVLLTKSDDDNYLELHLINNGLPFPEGFNEADFTNFGTKGNHSEGTGIGGYLMKKIVENHNGKFEWLCDKKLGISIDLEEKSFKIIANVYFKISLPYIN